MKFQIGDLVKTTDAFQLEQRKLFGKLSWQIKPGKITGGIH